MQASCPQDESGGGAAGLTLGRGVCEAACSSDRACQHYLWQESPPRCATFSSCPETRALESNKETAAVYSKHYGSDAAGLRLLPWDEAEAKAKRTLGAMRPEEKQV